MIEKFRKHVAAIFEVPEQKHNPSVKVSVVFAWMMMAGVVGGIMPFVWITNYGIIVSSLSVFSFIVLTAKPVLRKIIRKYD